MQSDPFLEFDEESLGESEVQFPNFILIFTPIWSMNNNY